MKAKLFALAIFVLVFTCLFYRESLGLNLCILEICMLLYLYFSGQLSHSASARWSLVWLVTTLAATVISFSVFAFIVHFTTCLLFIGIQCYPYTRSIVNAIIISGYNFIYSFEVFHDTIASARNTTRRSRLLPVLQLSAIPSLIVVIFIFLYGSSNPFFHYILGKCAGSFRQLAVFLRQHFNTEAFILAIVGCMTGIILLFKISWDKIAQKDRHAAENMERKKSANTAAFKFPALRQELRVAVVLLAVLNLLILVLNISDIYCVWFNFRWDGQYLKSFVHEGTYFLIVSILLSMTVALYIFRANLNFYSKSGPLKPLAYLWLAQNAILVVSVGVRTYWYIHYFALAYRRISVVVFLCLALFALFTIYVKVREHKTMFYLVRVNSMFFVSALVVSSLFNWDNMIARYNFRPGTQAFMHLDYLATLSDKSLPYLDQPLSTLTYRDSLQKTRFRLDKTYMWPSEYKRLIESRKTAFVKAYPSRGLLSWNLPEYLAYQELKQDVKTD